MAGRTADISTSSFKPLSLNEIMMVPLAMQAKEDNLNQLALDEFSALQSNALGADKEYVTGQVEALKKESGSITDDLMTNGYSKNLFNKFRKLKSKKDNELSIMGKTGQAAAAYNQYEANKANIMKDPRLTADQKKLGLQEALGLYESSGGAAGGAQYQDYVGSAYIDAMQKGRDIANQISPQEIAKRMGISQNKQGLYEENGYLTKTLSSETINKFVRQALEGDSALMAYANEYERLGLGTAEDMIAKSAENAGNIYQRKDSKDTSKLLPQYLQNSGLGLDPNLGRIDTSQPWDTMDIQYQDGVWNEQFNLPTQEQTASMFVDGMIPDEHVKYDEAREVKIKADRDLIKKLPISWKEKNIQLMAYNMRNKSYETLSKEQKGLKKSINALKENNPVLQELKPAVMNEDGTVKEPARYWTDKEIYKIYQSGANNSEKSFSKAIKPVNPNSTFVKIGQDLIGSGTTNGSFAQKHMKIAGHPSGGRDVIASQLGYGDDEMPAFNKMVRETGQVLGFAPGHIEMPGAYAVQVELEDGSTPIIYMQNDGKARETLGSISTMNKLIQSGNNYATKQLRSNTGDVVNEMTITELNPYTESYEAATIRSATNYTKDELDKINFKNVPGSGAVQIGLNDDGSPIVPKVFKLMYDDEMQRAINQTTKYYDAAPNAGQVLSKQQKN